MLLTSFYSHCMSSVVIFKKLAATNFFGQCQCLKIGNCAKESKIQNRDFEDFKLFKVNKEK